VDVVETGGPHAAVDLIENVKADEVLERDG